MDAEAKPLSPSSNPAFVLYFDHQGHPAPLTECFHATASRRLSSTSYRYPVATSQEVDSAYCPQCLAFHDAATAASMGYCSKPTCRRCPICLSVASVCHAKASDDSGMECFLKCGLCDWTSKNCNLSVIIPSNSAAADCKLDRLELMRAAEEMSASLAERRKQGIQPLDEMYKSLTNHWKNYRTQQRRHVAKRHEDQWSLELLEAKMKGKVTFVSSADAAPMGVSGMEVKRVSIQDILAQQATGDAPALSTRFSDDLSLLLYQLQSMDAEPSLPLPIPLSLRQSRRCRAELADGRPGILLKPKLNPLEGDSSIPTGHGQWYRKDSSAIHVIPRVRVVRRHELATNNEDGRQQIVLLKVSNPTLGSVRLCLSESKYIGEKDYWDEVPDATLDVTSSFVDLLVDTLSQTTVQATLKPDLTRSIGATDMVELSSAEDSIIELGGKTRRTPEAALNWSPAANEHPKDGPAALRLVAQSASDAWFELVVQDTNASNSLPGMATAIPLALEVGLGNGSWESSLIPAVDGIADDKVVFDLLIVLT